MQGDLFYYIKAGYPVLYLLTWEEARAELQIVDTVKRLNEASKKIKYSIRIWSHSEGIMAPDGKNTESIEDPIEALLNIKQDTAEGRVFIFRDLHKFFQAPKVLRLIRDIARDFKQRSSTLILISPVSQIPPEIQRDVSLIEFDLPTKEELATIWNNLVETNKSIGQGISEDEKEMIIQGAAGLTSIEAENAYSKAAVISKSMKSEERTPISKLVMREKAIAVKKNGILEYFEAQETIDSIGGLDNLKTFFKERKLAYTKKAVEFGLPKPRGIVLVGSPGCGKSLSAKAASNIMGIPLIKFDIGRVFGGLVGQSEENMRTAIQTIEAVYSCVVWIDEMDKAFAGTGDSGSGDSGVTKRVFGNFISWMQDKKCPAFTIATVNRIVGLPPELLRKGRFDEIFFVGLPSAKEREEILKIHVNRLTKKLKNVNINYQEVASVSDGYSGAELEEAVVAAMYKAFYKEEDTLKTEYIKAAILNSSPLSKSAAQNLKDMVTWAQQNAVPASLPSGDSSVQFSRKLNI